MKASLLSTILRGKTVVLPAMALAAMVTSAYAVGPNLVSNGGFETTTGTSGNTVSSELSNGSYSGAGVNSWTNANGSYNFVFVQSDHSANDESGHNDLTLKNFPGASANGGNFVALDADYNQGSISQVIGGLISGDTYTLMFDIATGQQTGYNPSNWNETLTASLGTSSHVFSLTNPNDDDWAQVSATFTATAASETLKFLAGGVSVNGNLPAFVLLDGISLNDTTPTSPTPEPGSLALLSTGLLGLGGMVRSRFKK